MMSGALNAGATALSVSAAPNPAPVITLAMNGMASWPSVSSTWPGRATCSPTTPAAAGAAVFIVGLCYLIIPSAAAKSFGLAALPGELATPWLRVKGVRDAVTGIVAVVLLVAASPVVISWCVLAFTLIPIGDAAIVLARRIAEDEGWAAVTTRRSCLSRSPTPRQSCVSPSRCWLARYGTTMALTVPGAQAISQRYPSGSPK